MLEKRRRRVDTRRSDFSFFRRLAAFGVEKFLVPSAFRLSIALLAPLIAKLATIVQSAAEGTTQIEPAPVARMRKEANPAVAAGHGALSPTRTIAQGRIERQLILTNKRKDAVVQMPILAKRKEFRDGDRKNERFSVTMLIVICMSSSYSLDAKASRGRARIFYASAMKRAPLIRAIDPRVIS